jgi:hypothetical protein
MSYEYPLFAEDISDISGETTGINNAVSAASNVPNNIRYVVMGLMELVMFMLLMMLVMSMKYVVNTLLLEHLTHYHICLVSFLNFKSMSDLFPSRTPLGPKQSEI